MRLVVLKTLAKLTFGIAALAAATSFGTSTSRAFGDAPWCAVKNLGKKATCTGTANTARSQRAIRTRWLIAAFAT
jgi:hypothetical protein